MHFYFKNQRFPTVFVVQIPQNFPLKVKILKSVVFCPKPLKSVVFAGHPPTPGGASALTSKKSKSENRQKPKIGPQNFPPAAGQKPQFLNVLAHFKVSNFSDQKKSCLRRAFEFFKTFKWCVK